MIRPVAGAEWAGRVRPPCPRSTHPASLRSLSVSRLVRESEERVAANRARVTPADTSQASQNIIDLQIILFLVHWSSMLCNPACRPTPS